MFSDHPVCAHCGHARLLRADIIDVWPSGLAGIAARARVKAGEVHWSRVRTRAWRVTTRLFGMSLAGSVALAGLLIVAGS